MEYRGVEITLKEATHVAVDTGTQRYSVDRSDGLVFSATSKYGASYASDPDSALQGARKQIDEGLAS